MVNESPAAVLFNRDGYDVVIADGYTVIPQQSGILMAGKNGSTAKFITLDGYGQAVVVGSGTAGSPSGGIITIQGIGSGTPVTVSGTVTVVQPTASNLHALVVGAAADGYTPIGNPVLVAGWDGINTRILRTATDGTVRIDPTGTTTQPVSQVGTWSVSQVTSPWITRDTIADGYLQSILANQTNGSQHTIVDGYVQTNPNIIVTNFPAIQPVSQSGTWTVQQGTPPWTVTGIASDNTTNSIAKLSVIVAKANIANPSWTDGYQVPLSVTADGYLRVLTRQGTSPWVDNITQFGGTNISTGTGAGGAGIPRVTISNDSNILATQSGTWTVQQGAPPWTISGIASDNTTNSTAKLPVLPARANASPPSWIDGYQVPLSTLLTGALRTDVTSWLGSTAPTVGQKVMASSIPVTMASNQAPIAVTFNVTGDTTGVSFGIRKLGGGSANLLFVMESTTYVEPTSAAQRSISSSSVNDTSAGTGARTVKIIYYDNSGAGPFSETLTLNGTVAVNTVATDIRFIEKLEVITVGSGGANVGTITLYGATGGGGGAVGSIGIGNILTGVGDNKTLWAHHYVGVGLTAKFSVLVTGIQSGGSATNGTFFIRAINPLIANAAEILVADAVLVIGAFERIFTFNPTVAGFARVTAYGIPGVNNSTMTCSFDWSEQ